VKLESTDARPVVALLIETSNAFSRALLRGVRDWIDAHGPWAIHFSEFGRGSHPPDWLYRWKGDGVIARVETKEIAKATLATGAPVVNVSAADIPLPFPSVISSSPMIAQLAADHLIDCGLTHFGYCGDARFPWSTRHGENFRKAIHFAGFPCSEYPSNADDALDWDQERIKLAHWLRSLPKPVGVMACYDIRGQQVLDVCREIGLRAPDEIAVIGQHNDEILCDLCDPPLSSVIPGARNAGYMAARLLDAMMRGEESLAKTHEIDPIGIATRQSTDVVAVDDPHIQNAIRYIRQNIQRPIGIDNLVEASGLSRTLLERRFQRLFQIPPYEYILRLRARYAERLVKESSMSIAQIANQLGFTSPERFNAFFKQRSGLAPGQFRRKLRTPIGAE